MATAKEKVYDEEISPLMAQIIAIAKRAKINMVADFSLDPDPDQNDEPLYCTTLLANVDKDDTAGVERMMKVRRALMERPLMFAMTITSTKET